jgi:hypothetical protein
MGGLRAHDPLGQVVSRVLRPEVAVADPPGGRPRRGIEHEERVSLLCLFHQPPLVAAVVVFVRLGVHVAQLRALGRIPVTGDLDIQLLQGRPVVGLEEVVENLRALGLKVVPEERGSCAAASHRADSVIGAPGAGAINRDGLGKSVGSEAEKPRCERTGQKNQSNAHRGCGHERLPFGGPKWLQGARSA